MHTSGTASSWWTLNGLLDHLHFVHTSMRDHAYAWVLGAGASKSSGIPLAGELAHRWLRELHRRVDRNDTSLESWATAENLCIPGFQFNAAASFYSRLYERRFGDNPDEGFAYLETLMSGKDPSPGYSILAQVLDKTPHKVVISTNFDNLVADALSIYTETFPLVIGHESLANFVRVQSRRPVICKIHRDLLLAPKNDHRSLRRLHESWAAALRALFSQYTPFFIGYGGNDDSLMDLLESLDPEDIKGKLIWCYHQRYAPSDRIVALVEQHRGALVGVPDFDLLMVLIGNKMEIEPIDDAIETRATRRAEQYRERLISLDTTTYPEVRKVLRGAFERAGETLAWHEKIRREISPEKREQLCRQALEEYPDDPSLQIAHATILIHNGLHYEHAAKLLAELKSKGKPFSEQAAFLAAELDINRGQFKEAMSKLSLSPNRAAFQRALGRAYEGCNDLDAAEEAYCNAMKLKPKGFIPLANLLSRRGRMSECSVVLSAAREECKDSDMEVAFAFFSWCWEEDESTARRVFGPISDRSSDPGGDHHHAQCDQLAFIACFFLAMNERDSYDAVMSKLRSTPIDSWWAEVLIVFIRLVEAVVDNKEITDLTGRAHELLSRNYSGLYTIAPHIKLLDTLKLAIPEAHRKFLTALAAACRDFNQRAALNDFPQWPGEIPNNT